MSATSPGSIILLNGTSSAGKSTLLKELLKLSPTLFQLKVDDYYAPELKKKAQELGWNEQLDGNPWLYLHRYLTKKTGNYYFDTEVREALFTEVPAYYPIAKSAALEGKSVIIDTVLEYESSYQQFFEFFQHTKIISILLYCPLNVLLVRVEQRNKSGIPGEYRPAFLSFEQFPAMYKIQETDDEQVVDTIKTLTMMTALYTAIKDLIDQNIPKEYLPKLEVFKQQFIKQFKLDEKEEVTLVSRHRYDLIVNSFTSSPQEVSLEILKILR